MNNSRTARSPGAHQKAPLYAMVFQSGFSVCVIFLLFLSLLMQPVHRAFANEAAEATADESPAAEAPAPEPEPEPVEEEVAADEEEDVEEAVETVADEDATTDASAEEDATSETEAAATTDTAKVDSTRTTTTSSNTSETTDSEGDAEVTQAPAATSTTSGRSTTTAVTDAIATSSDTTSTASTTGSDAAGGSGAASESEEANDEVVDEPEPEPVAANDENDADTPASGGGGGGVDVSDATDDEVADAKASTSHLSASTSDLIREVVESIEYLVTEENYYQFSRQSCVPVGEGAYHCSTNEAPVIDSQSVVYAELDDTGDTEIFIKTAKGNTEQITNNSFEDSAPHYDPVSLRIVWQRLIEGRYQIIMYDLKSDTETQLTFSRTNNMEPAVSPAGVAWQVWDGEDWEIMYFDGTYTDQLTDNQTQDLAPAIEEDYLIWTVVGGGSQYAQVYSIDSQEVVTINNHEGGSIVNPRFVLVYDTQFENGDIITQKFDPETGFSQPIAAQPAPEPIDIPDADTTGEIRALIQNKSSQKDSGVVVNEDGTPVGDDGDAPAAASVATTTVSDTGALDLSQSTSTPSDAVVEAATAPEPILVLDEYDLIITPEEVAEAFAEAGIRSTSSITVSSQ